MMEVTIATATIFV